MKEYSSQYKFEQGLRQFGEGSPGLVECYNVIPRRKQIIGHEALVSATSLAASWPYPQLFCFAGGNYLCGRNYIKTLDSSLNVVASINTVASMSPWTVVDFWQYVIFTNGAAIYVTDIVGGAISQFIGASLPVMKAISDFKGQLIGIGVTGYETNEVVHGAIGAATFSTTTEPVEVGTVPMKWSGDNVAAKRLGDKLVIYGDGGIAVLEIAQGSLAFRKIDVLPSSVQRLGVVAAGGDDSQHCFLDETGSLWKLGLDFNPVELGYREFLEDMLGGDIQISYDPRASFRDFYISDGSKCYLLSEYGLAEVHQLIGSVQLYRGAAYATLIDNGDLSWAVKTDDLDANMRSRKSVEWVEVDGDMLTHVQLSNKTVSSPVFPFSPEGRSKAKFAASDFKIRLSGPSYENVLLQSMNYRWKLIDKTSVRGEYASNAAARTIG